MDKQEKVLAILEALKAAYPDPVCALHYQKDYELLFAVRLSAQCTDERVNLITPALFAGTRPWRTTPEPISPRWRIWSTPAASTTTRPGYYPRGPGVAGALRRQGARDHGGAADDSRRGTEDGQSAAGRPVPGARLGGLRYPRDPHYQQAGLGPGQGAGEGGKAARAILPPEESSDFCHRVVLHGRAICTARKPQCAACPLAPYCDAFTGA